MRFWIKKICVAFCVLLLLTGCVNEVLHNIEEAKIEKKLAGRWVLKRVEPLNNQNIALELNFLYGEFDFHGDSKLDYSTGFVGESYQGTWNLSSREELPDCYTSPDGSRICSPVWNRLLYLNVQQVNGLQQKSASFESVTFQTDDIFTALIYVGFSGYRYHFERKR